VGKRRIINKLGERRRRGGGLKKNQVAIVELL
jgi:hypothetical protein